AEIDAPTEFSAEALAEAESATSPAPEIDLRDVPFVTLDPAGSKDLDQAFHLARAGSGFRVRYAIADVPEFVTPGGALDTEARLPAPPPPRARRACARHWLRRLPAAAASRRGGRRSPGCAGAARGRRAGRAAAPPPRRAFPLLRPSTRIHLQHRSFPTRRSSY